MPPTLNGDKVYTTGQAAALLGFSQQAVIRNFDAGRLAGFRIPGSRHRRIMASALEDFRRVHQLPQPEMFGPPRLTLEGTPACDGVGGVKCSVWEGKTGHGVPVRVRVAYVEAADPAEQAMVDRELALERPRREEVA